MDRASAGVGGLGVTLGADRARKGYGVTYEYSVVVIDGRDYDESVEREMNTRGEKGMALAGVVAVGDRAFLILQKSKDH